MSVPDLLLLLAAGFAAGGMNALAGGGTYDKLCALISDGNVDMPAAGFAMGDVVLGTFNKDDVADPAIAEAAFALAEGEVSDVVDGAFGGGELEVQG